MDLSTLDTLKKAKSIKFPELKHWNYSPCSQHTAPTVDCVFRECGGDLFDHQKVGISWLYFRKKGLVADVPGGGKTNIIAGLTALLKERNELRNKVIYIANTPSVRQVTEELKRFTRGISIQHADSTLNKSKRYQLYADFTDVIVIGYHIANNDKDILSRLNPTLLVIDDVDALLTHDNATHRSIAAIAKDCERVVLMNATNVQTKLSQLHAAFVPIGGHDILGSVTQFETRHIVQIPGSQSTGMNVRYKNIDELKSKVQPYIIRRKYEDFSDVRMPAIMPPKNVWLDLHPRQRAKYDELAAGVLRILTEEGERVKRVQALAKWTHATQICSSLTSLGEEDGPEASIKLDWLMHALTNTDLSQEKSLVFTKFLGTVTALQNRLEDQGIGFATIWGRESDPAAREAAQKKFWRDDNCRVIIGTTAIERSLNLQPAKAGINIDTHPNPARMHQILGRYRRPGGHARIYVFNLFTRFTQEEGLIDLLRNRQGLADYLNDESNELYDPLTPSELMRLISVRSKVTS